MNRIFGTALMLACGLLFAGSAEAALKVCNQTPKEVSVAVGFLDGAKGWTAQGWFNIASGACASPVAKRLGGSFVYLLVDGGLLAPPKSQSGGWFCTADGGFSTRNNDYAAGNELLCEAAGLNIEQFRAVAIKGGNATFNLQ
jgi:uncharacterized membrane protein